MTKWEYEYKHNPAAELLGMGLMLLLVLITLAVKGCNHIFNTKETVQTNSITLTITNK